jgi:lauroyl/myristoyl acyltransferase
VNCRTDHNATKGGAKLEPRRSKRLLEGISFLATKIPFGVAQCFFAAIGSFLYGLLLLTPHRRLLANRIQHALQTSLWESHGVAAAHVRLMFESLVEIVRLNEEPASLLKTRVAIFGVENLEAALAQGKGVIILSAHFGNWELIAPKLSLMHYSVTAVMQPMPNKVFDSFFRQLRATTGTTIIDNNRGGIRQGMQTLRQNGLLLLLADQHPFTAAPEIEFLGHNTPIQTGPALLALATGATIIPTFCIREKRGYHRIVMEKPLDYIPEGDKAADVDRICRLYHQVYERYIKEHPDHWLWFHDRWLIGRNQS